MSQSQSGLQRFVARLSALPPEALAGRVAHVDVLPARPGRCAPLQLVPGCERLLERRGIAALHEHQARALAHWRAGHDVLLATGTASGKTLVYNLAVAARALREPEAHSLFLFPLKALARDQLGGLRADLAALPNPALLHNVGELRADVYDGDTSPYARRKLRESPPQVLITNPDMLHAGLLANHASWQPFFEKLRLVVIDEVHSYRGALGAHVAQVLRRMLRIAAHYGAEPQVIACSATIGNPDAILPALCGRTPRVVSEDRAPRPASQLVLVDPQGSSYTTAAQLFRRCVREGLRTIAFTQARRVTELMHSWILESDPDLAGRVASYRSGFLPEERREIERRLFDGELLGVIATSALELGIDVGGLDACILVGYPGSILTTRQRAGRVGRRNEGVVFLVPQQDALDRWFLAHPEELVSRACEPAVLDPANPEILAAHLPCAGAELPLREDEPWLAEPGVRAALELACRRGELLESARGGEYFAARRRPQRRVSLRQAGEAYTIGLGSEGERPERVIGTIGGSRVFSECHEGAIYLHAARAYQVLRLDLERREVRVRGPLRVDHYTRALGEKDTEILEIDATRPLGNALLRLGRLRITSRTTHYEKRRVFGQDLLSKHPLELPPQVMETEGCWLELAPESEDAIAAEGGHFMGAMHGLEHAALALFPLFALCDRLDVGGISIPRHPQVRGPAIFFHDGAAGGLGLCRALFPRIEALLEATLEVVRSCDCAEGCPSCIHSPRCSNGNRPLDKAGTVRLLPLVLGQEALPPATSIEDEPPFEALAAPAATPERTTLIFDVETQRSAKEVGGWHNTHLMRLALAVVYDTGSGEFTTYREDAASELIERLRGAAVVIGFNSRRFDYAVLGAYASRPLSDLPTFDLLEEVHARLGYRLSLDHLATHTLGREKSGDGLQSLEWWRRGEVERVEQYCREDVALTRDLLDYGAREGHLLFRKKDGPVVRLPVEWQPEAVLERASQPPARA